MDIENIDTENACSIGDKNECTFGYRKGVICVAPMTHLCKFVVKFVEIQGKSPKVEIVFQGGTSFVDQSCYFCRVFVMLLCASAYCCLVVTCWERADLLALVCDV